MPDSNETKGLFTKASEGDKQALGELIGRHANRLQRMIRLRLDPRLKNRIDEADVLQEVSLEALRRFPEYVRKPDVPFFLWLRFLTRQRLAALWRLHLGAQVRDRRREIHLESGPSPTVTSQVLAAKLLGKLTSPSVAAQRLEQRERLHRALDAMDPMDREVLSLRHFEHLGNLEVARELGMRESAASKRYVRAIEKLRAILGPMDETRSGEVPDDDRI